MTTPGYSGRSQAAKLGLKPGQRVDLHNPPDGWSLTDPPGGLAGPGPDGTADVILAFFSRAEEIGEQIGELARRIYPAGALWVAWPRRAAATAATSPTPSFASTRCPSGWSTSRWPPSTTTGPACGWSGAPSTARTVIRRKDAPPYRLALRRLGDNHLGSP